MKTKIFVLSALIAYPLINPFTAGAIAKTDPVKQASREFNETGRPTLEITPELQRIREQKASISAEKKEVKENRKDFLTQTKLRVVEKIYANAQKALQKRYEYLVETRKKIQEKLTKRAADGKDISVSTTKINQAVALESSYLSAMKELDAKYQEMIKSETPLKMIPDLRQAASKVNEVLKQIRGLQVEALTSVIKN